MAAKNTLEEAMGVRKTRAAHILIEFDRTAIVSEVAVKLRAALSDTTKVAALENRATVQVKNIDSPHQQGEVGGGYKETVEHR